MKNLYLLLVFSLLGSVTHLSYAQTDIDSTQNESEFIEILKQPEFPGGVNEMMKFLSNQVKYPKVAVDNGIEGTAAVQFIVDKDGSLYNINVVKNPGGGLGAEAERVVRSMPNWKPGLDMDGQPIRVKMVIPIRFSLTNKSKKSKK